MGAKRLEESIQGLDRESTYIQMIKLLEQRGRDCPFLIICSAMQWVVLV